MNVRYDVAGKIGKHGDALRVHSARKEIVAIGSSAPPGPRIFYGWFVVAAAFAVSLVGFGSAYTFSAFVESLQRRRPGRQGRFRAAIIYH